MYGIPGPIHDFPRYLPLLLMLRTRPRAGLGFRFWLSLTGSLEPSEEVYRVGAFSGDPTPLAHCVAKPETRADGALGSCALVAFLRRVVCRTGDCWGMVFIDTFIVASG